MRAFIAILAGLVIFGLGMATVRGFALPRGGHATPAPEAARPAQLPGVRILYWCDTCGTELLVIRAGSEVPPKHCGEPMTRREEVGAN